MDLFTFREKHPPQTECAPSQRVSATAKYGMVSLYISWVISYVIEWEDYSNYFGEGQRFPGFGPLPTPWSFNSALELSWHLWVCHFTCWLRIKVLSAILVPQHNRFMLCPWAMSFFESCALPLSLQLQKYQVISYLVTTNTHHETLIFSLFLNYLFNCQQMFSDCLLWG